MTARRLAAGTLTLIPPPPLGPEGRTPLARWTCHKQVSAARILAVDVILAVLLVELPDGTAELRHGRAHMFATRTPEVGEYYVEYDDGYRSISPAAAFLAGYLPIRPEHPVKLSVDESVFTADQLGKLRTLWARFCRDGQAAGILPGEPGCVG